MSSDARNKVFSASIDTIQDSHALKVERRVEQWTWFFRSFVQWHALAYVMAELCHRTGTPEVDRAWKVLDEVLGDKYTIKTGTKQSALWQPLHWLLRKAQEVRANDLRARASTSAHISPSLAVNFFGNQFDDTYADTVGLSAQNASLQFAKSNTPTLTSANSFNSSHSALTPLDYALSTDAITSSNLNIDQSIATLSQFSDPYICTAPDVNMQGLELTDTSAIDNLEDPLVSLSQNLAGASWQQITPDVFEQFSSAEWMDFARDWTMDI